MRRPLFAFLSCLSFFFAYSCEKDELDIESPIIENVKVFLDAIHVDSFRHDMDIAVGRSDFINVSCDGGFVSVSAVKGKTVTVSIQQNRDFLDREGTLIVCFEDGETIGIPIVQDGFSSLIGADMVFIDHGIAEIEILYNQQWTILSGDGSKTLFKGNSSGMIQFPYEEDKGFVIVDFGGNRFNLPVASIESVSRVNMGNESGTYYPEDTATDGMFFTTSSWIRFSYDNGHAGIHVAPNDGELRKGFVVQTDGSGTIVTRFSIIQAAGGKAEEGMGIFLPDGSPLFTSADDCFSTRQSPDGEIIVTDIEGYIDIVTLKITEDVILEAGRRINVLIGGMLYGFKEEKAVVELLSISPSGCCRFLLPDKKILSLKMNTKV